MPQVARTIGRRKRIGKPRTIELYGPILRIVEARAQERGCLLTDAAHDLIFEGDAASHHGLLELQSHVRDIARAIKPLLHLVRAGSEAEDLAKLIGDSSGKMDAMMGR